MPTLHEWLEGQTVAGRMLPLDTVNRYRAQRGLEPLAREEAAVEAPAMNSPTKMPSLLERVGRFVQSQKQHLLAGSPKCTDAQIQERLALCEACDKFDGRHCLVCGCRCSGANQWLNKLAWADQQCPHPDSPRWAAFVPLDPLENPGKAA